MKYLRVVIVCFGFILLAPFLTILAWADWASGYTMSDAIDKIMSKRGNQ